MHTRSLSVLLALTSAAATAQAAPPAAHADSYMLLRDADTITMMSGDIHEIEHVKKLRQTPSERLIWFRLGGSEYVIRDPATIAQAEAIWKLVQQLGNEMGKLGGEQGKLGAKQGEVGAQLGALGARMGQLGSELGQLEMRDPATKAERKELRKRRHALKHEMRDLEAQMDAMQAQISPYEGPMNDLGKQMDALGKRMEAASKKASAETDALFARAIASGTAKRI